MLSGQDALLVLELVGPGMIAVEAGLQLHLFDVRGEDLGRDAARTG